MKYHHPRNFDSGILQYSLIIIPEQVFHDTNLWKVDTCDSNGFLLGALASILTEIASPSWLFIDWIASLICKIGQIWWHKPLKSRYLRFEWFFTYFPSPMVAPWPSRWFMSHGWMSHDWMSHGSPACPWPMFGPWSMTRTSHIGNINESLAIRRRIPCHTNTRRNTSDAEGDILVSRRRRWASFYVMEVRYESVFISLWNAD